MDEVQSRTSNSGSCGTLVNGARIVNGDLGVKYDRAPIIIYLFNLLSRCTCLYEKDITFTGSGIHALW
jgi:hypothetical protein